MLTPDEKRTIAAAFAHVRVGELLPFLDDVASDTSVSRTNYLARCPSCDHLTLSFAQGKSGIG